MGHRPYAYLFFGFIFDYSGFVNETKGNEFVDSHDYGVEDEQMRVKVCRLGDSHWFIADVDSMTMTDWGDDKVVDLSKLARGEQSEDRLLAFCKVHGIVYRIPQWMLSAGYH